MNRQPPARAIGCLRHRQVALHHLGAFHLEVVPDDALQVAEWPTADAGGSSQRRRVGHDAATVLLGDGHEGHREALDASLSEGVLVHLYPLRIDHRASLRDVVHVEGHRLCREGENEVHGVAMGIDGPLRQADLVEIVPAADAGPIVLRGKDLEPAARESLTQARSTGFHPLARVAPDQDAHIIRCTGHIDLPWSPGTRPSSKA
jgi:hypothetical protein